MQEPDADVEAALHPARVRLRLIIGTLGETDDLQDLLRACARLFGREPVQPREEGEILVRGEVGVDRQFLRDEADRRLRRDTAGGQALAGHERFAGIRLEQPGDDRDGRRLAGAVRSEQPVTLAGRDLEADTVDGLDIAEALTQALATEDGLAHGSGVSQISAGGCQLKS